MEKLTCTVHGDQANALINYWTEQHRREAQARQWFMAATALGCLLEAFLYSYFIIWSGDENNDPTKDEQIPDNLVLNDLLEAAKQADLLTPGRFKDEFGDHAVQDVVHELRHLRNNIHAGVALRKGFDPAKFTKKDYMRLKKIFAAFWTTLNVTGFRRRIETDSRRLLSDQEDQLTTSGATRSY